MRRLETEVRNQKDIRELAKSSGDAAQVNKCNAKIKAFQSKYNEISEITGIAKDPKRMSVPKIEKNSQNNLTNSGNGGIIQTGRKFSSRNMANGGRKSVYHPLNDEEIALIKADIKALEADETVFKINYGLDTYYDDEQDIIFVRGNVLPDLTSKHPRDLMSSRAVLAHEYYGHRAHRGTKLPSQSWNDEFRASYSAAKNAPNLTDEDRQYLILDALERAKENGITIRYNNYIRRILNG